MNFEAELKSKVKEIEEVLSSYLPPVSGYQKNIMKVMEYSLMSGGKRIRPMLMKESFNLFSKENSLIEPFMAAIEMIHTYSLVHDDLPAMDNDEYRRGRKTTHAVFGEDMGILAGDSLLNYAFETAMTTFETNPEKSEKIGKALMVLANKAGIYGMIGGQVIDIESSGHEISLEVLNTIYTLKTAALMEASMMIGGILGGASGKEINVLEDVARNIGIAFQIQDDILDVTSTLEVLGKAIKSDEKNKKTTYVTLKSFEEAKVDVKTFSSQGISQLQSLKKESEFLEKLLLFLINRKY